MRKELERLADLHTAMPCEQMGFRSTKICNSVAWSVGQVFWLEVENIG